MSEIVEELCSRSLHSHRDTIAKGYISLKGGVRVGITGDARYESGELVGIGNAKSLCFRIPDGKCDFAREVYKIWLDKGRPNMMITSPPGGGKTTLLRSLALLCGLGRDAMRTVVIDERRELMSEDYRGSLVDILSGYKRSEGLEIAIRTMSCQTVLVDEVACLGVTK
jgi:stage III sporulation protein AA